MIASAKMTKVERLALAGAVAPALRGAAGVTASRRVTLVGPDGNVVGYTTLLEVQKALLARHALEIEVQPDERPREIICERCGLPTKVRCLNAKRTTRCESCTFLRCADCEVDLPRNYSAPSMMARIKSGAPLRCRECAKQARARVRQPLPECADCKKTLSRTAEWQHRVRYKRTGPLRCAVCELAARPRKPTPTCARCSKELPGCARTRRGGRPLCKACYDDPAVRRETALAKMAADPSFKAKAEVNLRKGREKRQKAAG